MVHCSTRSAVLGEVEPSHEFLYVPRQTLPWETCVLLESFTMMSIQTNATNLLLYTETLLNCPPLGLFGTVSVWPAGPCAGQGQDTESGGGSWWHRAGTPMRERWDRRP